MTWPGISYDVRERFKSQQIAVFKRVQEHLIQRNLFQVAPDASRSSCRGTRHFMDLSCRGTRHLMDLSCRGTRHLMDLSCRGTRHFMNLSCRGTRHLMGINSKE